MHSVQCVIATDGISSFVLNLYDNHQFLTDEFHAIEFFEGQDSLYNVYTEQILLKLQEKNLYRVDGRY